MNHKTSRSISDRYIWTGFLLSRLSEARQACFILTFKDKATWHVAFADSHKANSPDSPFIGGKNSLIISGTVYCDNKWDKVKTTCQWKIHQLIPGFMSSLSFISSVPLALLLLFLTVLIPHSCSHGKVQEQNSRLSKTTYQKPNREKRCQQLVSNGKTDLWQNKEKRCTNLLSLTDYLLHLKKNSEKNWNNKYRL